MPTVSLRITALQRCLTSLLFLLSAPAWLWAGQLMGDTTPKLAGQELINALKQGGYVIYFRHGITGKTGDKEVADKDVDNCTLQRNLSAEGQAQTRAIGAAFKKQQIPVGQVYASPYCRCVETAQNIFGKAEKSPALHFAMHIEKAERGVVSAKLLDMLATLPQPGTNTAVVSHSANLKEAVNLWPKNEGDAYIFKPAGEGKFSFVGMMLAEQWDQ